MQNDRQKPGHAPTHRSAADPPPVVLAAIREVTRKELPSAVAGILLFPEFVCRQRPCLRHRDCALVAPAGQPDCLADRARPSGMAGPGPAGPGGLAGRAGLAGPGGLAGLDPALRALHEALHGEALRFLIEITGDWSPRVTPPSRDPDERELQDAAVAVVRALLPPGSPLQPRIRAWCRARDAVTAPPYAGRDLLDLRDFMRFIGARRIGPVVTGDIPAPRHGRSRL